MEKMIQLFNSVDIYYCYAEGQAYRNGVNALREFERAYESLDKTQKRDFYEEAIKINKNKVEFLNLKSHD